MVSKASEDLPEPESPVMTMSLSRGSSTSMFLRLCSRAPLTMILSIACPPFASGAQRAGHLTTTAPFHGRGSFQRRGSLSRRFGGRQAFGEIEGGEEAGGAGATGAGDVVRHSMIG